jgi:hypothetical protein
VRIKSRYRITFVLLVLAVLYLSSCGTIRRYKFVANDSHRDSAERFLLSKACMEEFPVQSIYIKGKDSIVFRDTTIVLPGQVILDSFTIPCPDFEHVGSKVTVKISQGKGTVRCQADSIKVILDSVIKESKRIDTLRQVDSAKVHYWQTRSTNADARVFQYQTDEKKIGYILKLLFLWLVKRWWFYVLLVLIGLYFYRSKWAIILKLIGLK